MVKRKASQGTSIFITSTLKLLEADKYLNGSPEMPSSHHPVNLSERLFSDKQVTTRLSLWSIAFTAQDLIEASQSYTLTDV